jgi:phenylpropionate dioxygenase-like ring-hydroxylating dioxygenase large terminal subunit
MFLRNAWYVAAWGREVGRTLLRRVLLEEPVVLYRTEDGRAVALEDRCCHRRYPLSDGRLKGDRLQCHYHGLEYEPDGRCVFAPGVAALPPQARVRAYPLLERHKWLWIWMGDPALADPALIEDFHWLDDPAWGAEGTYYHVKGDYRLIIENLLDLTHLTYVHDATIGNYATANAAEMRAEPHNGGVRVTRWMIDTPPPPTYVKAGGFVGNVDRWQIIAWTPPANVRLDVGATPTGTGAPQGRRVGGIEMWNLNSITPETANTCHYFWAQAHNFEPRNRAVTEMLFQQIHTTFLQDVAIFEKQHANIALRPEAPHINLPFDSGNVQALRILDRLIRAEQQAQPRAAAE